MQTLTSRERLLRLLRGEPIDRVPVSPRIHTTFIFEYFNRADVDWVEGAVEVYKAFDLDIIDWNCTPGLALRARGFHPAGAELGAEDRDPDRGLLHP